MSISECDDLITTRIVLVSAIQIQDRVCRLSESVVVTNLSDSYIHLEPFIDNLAFNSTTDRYCALGTQSEVMLASLQLFNHVPTRIMDLVIFMVTHPNFDPEQVTLRDAKDIIRDEKSSTLCRHLSGVWTFALRAHWHLLDFLNSTVKRKIVHQMRLAAFRGTW